MKEQYNQKFANCKTALLDEPAQESQPSELWMLLNKFEDVNTNLQHRLNQLVSISEKMIGPIPKVNDAELSAYPYQGALGVLSNKIDTYNQLEIDIYRALSTLERLVG